MRLLSFFPILGLLTSLYIYLLTFFSFNESILDSEISIYVIFLFLLLMMINAIPTQKFKIYSLRILKKHTLHNKKIEESWGRILRILTVILMFCTLVNFAYYGNKLGNDRVEKTYSGYVLKNRTTTIKKATKIEYQNYRIFSTRLLYGHYIFFFFYLFKSSLYYKLPDEHDESSKSHESKI